jgi:hypothetical protein
MKNILIGLVITSIIGGGIFFFITTTKQKTDMKEENVVSTQSVINPTRPAEINGTLLSVEGNELTIANEIGRVELSEEAKAARQRMTQEERRALKAQESVSLTKETVILTIPVGTPLVKGSGSGGGENIPATFDEIRKGAYVSIWKTGEQIEFLKLKGTSQ